MATGLFSSPKFIFQAYGTDEHAGWFYEVGRGSLDTTLFTNQLLCAVLILSWVSLTMTPFFIWLNYMGWFRSDALEEMVGLDLSYNMFAGVSGGSVGASASSDPSRPVNLNRENGMSEDDDTFFVSSHNAVNDNDNETTPARRLKTTSSQNKRSLTASLTDDEFGPSDADAS